MHCIHLVPSLHLTNSTSDRSTDWMALSDTAALCTLHTALCSQPFCHQHDRSEPGKRREGTRSVWCSTISSQQGEDSQLRVVWRVLCKLVFGLTRTANARYTLVALEVCSRFLFAMKCSTASYHVTLPCRGTWLNDKCCTDTTNNQWLRASPTPPIRQLLLSCLFPLT